MQKENEKKTLIRNLIRVLRNLEFSNIRAQDHSGLPEPCTILSVVKEDFAYKPPMSAYKHGVTYYFEIVINSLYSAKGKHPLQEMTELRNKKWNIDLVLVTKYGNKASLEKNCQNISLSTPQIWEL